MKLLIPLAVGLLATIASLPAAARGVPPPPVLTPPELDKPIDGYDLRIPYQLWWRWIENRKGPVIEAQLDAPAPPPGEKPFGSPQLRFRGGWELGQSVGGDAQVYCKPRGSYGVDRDSCHIVLRQVRVPVDVGGFGGANPLSRWMRENFRAQDLARHLKAEGFTPDTDWWRADRARMFAASTSPDAALKAAVRIDRVDSRDCPAMAKAFDELDKARLDLRLDLFGVDQDTPSKAPAPHSSYWAFTLDLTREDGLSKLETTSRQVGELVFPILKAADACANAALPQQ